MKSIKFLSRENENSFFEEVKLSVNKYFTQNDISPHADREMLLKCFFWILIFICSWIGIIIFRANAILVFTFGILHLFTHVMIAFNITHDANHHAMFKSPKMNLYFGYLIEILGCSRKIWILGHNQEHHTFINIHEHDNNIQGYKLLRLCPQDKLYKFHKFQFLYAPLVYGLSTLNYATFRDFKMILKYVGKSKFNLSTGFVMEFIFFKILYYLYLFIIPIFVFKISFFLVLAYFLVGHFINGLFLALIFVTGHLTEETSFPDINNNTINSNWAVHVVKTTGDYATGSSFMQWLVGGINLHVAHHLFPKICHVHYKNISPIIKRIAEKHGLCYREIPTFGKALRSHFTLLKSLGTNGQ